MYDNIVNNRPCKWINKEVLAWGAVVLVALVLCACAWFGYKEWRYQEMKKRAPAAEPTFHWKKKKPGFTRKDLKLVTNMRILFLADRRHGSGK